ncbi:RsfA family transcriptional regulator [Virgibacillus kekensis]|uniref:RsfA family transcriptional regulator n=1 Tax=Virgibacillus kekensis TaxID=202261 RepID=A0ABV9DLN8_9BACI
MVKVRQDAWSHEDDLLLAETVLRHIREGSTQLNAFEEVGDKLNRTSAACGFRWNAEVRNKYENAIDLAKRQRKERKRARAGKPVRAAQTILPATQTQSETSSETYTEAALQTTVEAPAMTLDGVIRFLKEFKKDYYASNQSKASLEHVQKENEELKEQINDLEKKLAETEKQYAQVQEDYQVFMQIMDRARKMTVLDDQGSLKPPTFRMDKNGNLQQVAQSSSQ